MAARWLALVADHIAINYPKWYLVLKYLLAKLSAAIQTYVTMLQQKRRLPHQLVRILIVLQLHLAVELPFSAMLCFIRNGMLQRNDYVSEYRHGCRGYSELNKLRRRVKLLTCINNLQDLWNHWYVISRIQICKLNTV